MSSKAEESEKNSEEKPKKSKKKLAMFVVVGLVSLVSGAGIATIFVPQKPTSDAHEDEEVQAPAEEIRAVQTADLGQFIVNLSDMTSFIKVRIMIEYDSNLLDRQLRSSHGRGGGKAHGGGASGGEKEPAGGGMHPHLMKKEHQFRDIVIRILSAKKADDLLTVEGKARLKDELLDGLNDAVGLEEPAIQDVLFTDFMIQ